MDLRHYGIYLAYSPFVDLRSEGLGRQLAMFMKGASELPDVRFTIVCPSWSKKTIALLFESEGVRVKPCQIVSPRGIPYVLRLFLAFRAYRMRPSRTKALPRLIGFLRTAQNGVWSAVAVRAVRVHGAWSLFVFLALAAVLCVVATPFMIGLGVIVMLQSINRLAVATGRRVTRFGKEVAVAFGVEATVEGFRNPYEGWLLNLFDEMLRQEQKRMHALIVGMSTIRGWYCPTAFWPEFHNIKSARLVCVPDVVLSEFPAGFSKVGGDGYLKTFESISEGIRSGEHFVTYSQAVKWGTLVERYGISPSRVTVIPHAPSNLNPLIEMRGFSNPEAVCRHYCEGLLRTVFQLSTNKAYSSSFANGGVKFLFYASQFRPNKNVLTLLKAYKYLLKRRYFEHKLLLTGSAADMIEISDFVADNHLENDVMFVRGLSTSQLAACYKLADLAVNPSLSEGGFPFTFSEALSVGTPVVMARTVVSEEVLSDEGLREMTFFDPFDWRDCAEKIEGALGQHTVLLKAQQVFYQQFQTRSWVNVVEEHVTLLEHISASFN